MTNVQTIQEELIAVYETIVLPNSLGLPTGFKHEPEGGFDSADLPAVVVTRGIQVSSTTLGTDSSQVVREYIVDLLTYSVDDEDPVNATNRNNTSDCIESVIESFSIHGLSSTLSNLISADTADVVLYQRDTAENNIMGVRFRHEINYFQIMT